MCKEIISTLIRKLKLPGQVKKVPPPCSHEYTQEEEHHHHDDAEEKAHHGHERSDLTRSHLIEAHNHEHHDDVLSLAHRHHDHQHPIHLMKGVAGVRQHSCHAGDGHDHGSASQVMTTNFSAAPMGIPFGGGHQHHHEEGEHEHCPQCDEHLVDDKCQKCGYEHSH